MVVSDQGREFCNQLIDLLEQPTTQSNGLDKRLNQMLKLKLQQLVNECMDDWNELIDNILFAYQSSRQHSTKCTPFLLMYGREACLPIQLTQATSELDEDDQGKMHDRAPSESAFKSSSKHCKNPGVSKETL